jgi:segregation and condensation protein A
MTFRVDLPAYRGPLDLLLYLVRRHEVSLGEMPVAPIVDQYFAYIEVLQELDLGDVGDFIDLASTLVELKSQAVLPQVVEEADEQEIEDPQAELVERLLQYKQIRDAASILDEMGSRWQQRYPRLADDLPARRVDLGDQPIVDLEIWDLVSAFGRIMREAGGPPPTEVIYDETPIHVYMKRIHTRLGAVEKVPLLDFLEAGIHKSSLIGWFLATLELARHHGAAIEQDASGEIYVVRTANYTDELNVNEVDNYRGQEVGSANKPGQPR